MTSFGWPVARAVLMVSQNAMFCAVIASITFNLIDPAAADASWPMYGMDVRHTGYNPNETTLSPNNVNNLQVKWRYDLGGISAQPIYASGVIIGGQSQNVVYVGDYNNTFYAFAAATGTLLWSRHFAQQQAGCGWSAGIDATATIDQSTNTIYVGEGSNHLHALDMSTGQDKWSPPVLVGNNINTHIWGAITQDQSTKVIYVPKGSSCENSVNAQGQWLYPYVGSVIGYNPDGSVSGLFSAAMPADDYLGGGIWGAGGVSINQSDGRVYAATGNVSYQCTPCTSCGGPPCPPHEEDWYGEHVLRLAGGSLSVVDGDAPQPSQVVNLTSPPDRDIGSTPMLFNLNDTCTNLLTVKRKTGELLVYNNQNLGLGVVQSPIQVGNNTGSGRFLGVTATSPVTRMVYVTSPDDSDFANQGDPYNKMKAGLTAFNVSASCQLSFAWNQATGFHTDPSTDGLYSSPSVANGVVYYGDGPGRTLYAVDASNGSSLWSTQLNNAIIGTPSIVGGMVFVGTFDLSGTHGTTSLYGLGLP